MEERCSESETFLEKDDGNAVWGKKRGKGISLDRVKEVLLLAYVPLVVVYAVLAFGYYSSSSSLGAPGAGAIDLNLFPSLRESWAVRTEKKIYKLVDSNFMGKPEPAIDEAWHELLGGVTFRVSKRDLDFYNVTSLPLADGSGYASATFVSHELHCLKRIRQWKYKEYYYPRQLQENGPELAEIDRHVDHCIEILRQGVMCRGDVSLGTYSYIKGTANVTATTWGHHQCIDYGSLSAWIKAREVNISREGVLVPPQDLG